MKKLKFVEAVEKKIYLFGCFNGWQKGVDKVVKRTKFCLTCRVYSSFDLIDDEYFCSLCGVFDWEGDSRKDEGDRVSFRDFENMMKR